MRSHSISGDRAGGAHRAAGLVTLACVLAAALLGCSTATPSGSSDGTSAQPGQSTDTGPGATRGPAPTDCRQRIEAARLDSDESMVAVEACRFTVEGLHASRDVLAAGGSDDVMWAAMWVYATGGADPAPLRSILDREDPSVRVLAAAGLVAFGDATGFSVLAAEARDKSWLAGSHPPITIREFVVGTLYRYVADDEAPGRWTTYEEFLTVDQRWADWLTTNRARLAFNAEAGTWTLP